MSQGPRRVAIVGATGAVGRELLSVLEQRRFPVRQLRLLASPRSVGAQLSFCGAPHEVEALHDAAFTNIDVALFAVGTAISRCYAPAAVRAGAIVVDNSSAFRLDSGVPLVVPEVNAATAAAHGGVIANPNCTATLLALALAPLERAVGIARVVVATYQAASGAGQRAVTEWRSGTRAYLDGAAFTPTVLAHDLGANLFPHVGEFEPDGYTGEENKLWRETAKILAVPGLQIEATCVRVPVERSHSAAVSVELRAPLLPAEARKVLAAAPGLVLHDDPATARVPQPRERAGQDAVAVGRVRASRAFAPGLCFWLVGDQLRKGAALNAVQIAEIV